MTKKNLLSNEYRIKLLQSVARARVIILQQKSSFV